MGCFSCCGASAGSQLLDAARVGEATAARQLVANNPSVLRKAQQWGGQTAWHLAAKEGRADVLRSMAEAVRNLDPQQLKTLSKYGSTVEDILRNLAGEPDSKCLTPLHLACIKGHAEAAEVLMSYGVNPFAMDSVGRTALHYAASWGFADCLNVVLSAHSGPPKPEWEVAWPNNEDTRLVDVQNYSGFTPLHYAVWVGRKEAIQALASYDASLKVVNTSSDYDWIKVGTGNTPLHLAAFGGDFEVVRLLLAAHVQTLSAGTEVMAAARGQWGERHADDVRHMRNRRGLMAYHIAMHKHFQHLAELLHPDIPYTFIFSNDDMEVGSVRMFGPPRLMVIAAKALQQKLVDELSAVESGKSVPAYPAAAKAAGKPPGLVLGQRRSGLTPDVVVAHTNSDVGMPASSASTADGTVMAGSTVMAKAAQNQQQDDDEDDTSKIASPVGELLSPFLLKSRKKWTASSLSERSGSTASVDTNGFDGFAAAPAPAAGPAVSFISDTTTDAASVTAGADAAVSFTSAQIAAAAAAAAVGNMGAAPQQEFSFAPLAPEQQAPAANQQQQPFGSNASDAGLSSSTLPGSNSAVAGTPAGSVISSMTTNWPEASPLKATGSSSGGRWLGGNYFSSSGSRLAEVSYSTEGSNVQGLDHAAAAAAGNRSMYQPLLGASSISAPGVSLNHAGSANSARANGIPAAAAAAAAAGQPRRAQSVAGVLDRDKRGAAAVQRQGSVKGHTRRATADWLRPMDSLRKAASTRSLLSEDVLPPSIIITTAADDDDSPNNSSHHQQQQQQQSSTAGSSRVATPDELARFRLEFQHRQQLQQQQQDGFATPAAASDDGVGPSADNPVDVMLANRASTIGDNLEAIRQNLLLLKLASGAVNFNTAVSAACASNAGSPSSNGSFTAQHRQQIAEQPLLPEAAAPAGSSAGDLQYSPDRRQQQQNGGRSSVESQGSKLSVDGMISADGHAAVAATAAAAATARQMRRSASISRSMLARQPSLQRLLSGSSRHRLSKTHRHSPDLAAAADAAVAATMLEAAGNADLAVSTKQQQEQQHVSPAGLMQQGGTVSLVAAASSPSVSSSTGGLPIIQQQQQQQQKGGPAGAAITSSCSGIKEETSVSDDADDENVCEICFDAKAVVALQACGHTLCVTCCKEMCKLHHFKPALCPYCRQIICGFVRAAV